MVEQVVAGVAGAGVFGGHHAAKYAALPGVQMAAVFDVDPERAAALARKVGARAFSTLDAFLDNVDALTVAAPASAHFDIAGRALAKGRHVLIEKPIALRLDDADRLIALAEENGAVLQVGHQERFVFDAFGILSRQRKPLSVRCIRANPPTGRGEDVSVVFDLMIHDIDLVCRLGLGAPVSIVSEGSADEVEAEVTCAGGAVVTMKASRLSPARDRRMRLVYDDGIVEIDFVNRTIENTTGAALAASFDDAAPNPAFVDPLGYGVSRFIDAVRGEGPAPITGAQARAALDWALRIEGALDAAAPVPVMERARA